MGTDLLLKVSHLRIQNRPKTSLGSFLQGWANLGPYAILPPDYFAISLFRNFTVSYFRTSVVLCFYCFTVSYFRSFVLSFFHIFELSQFRNFIVSYFRSFVLSLFRTSVRCFVISLFRSLVLSLFRTFFILL